MPSASSASSISSRVIPSRYSTLSSPPDSAEAAASRSLGLPWNAMPSPAFWISYDDALYFQPKNEAQVRQLEAMKAARSKQ